MYLLIGIIVGLHLWAALINWKAVEKEGKTAIACWGTLGLLFGFFSVAAYKIGCFVRRKSNPAENDKTKIKKRKLTKNERKEEILGMLMAGVPFIGFICFAFFPTIVSVITSFYKLNSYNVAKAQFVGFENFITLLFHEPSGSVYVPSMVNRAFLNTLTYCLSVPLRIVVTVFVANLMAKPIKKCVNTPVRLILFLPSLCSSVGVTLIWQWILQTDYGIVNTVLSSIGLKKIGFMTDPNYFWFSVILMVLWMRVTNIINLQAALANVSASLCEAAEIDGATRRQVFWKITLPAITPTLFYIITMDLIAALQESGIMQFVTTNGVGPDFKAVTLSYYVYRMAFTSMATDGLGLGCALALMMAIFIITVNKLNFSLADRWVSYDD